MTRRCSVLILTLAVLGVGCGGVSPIQSPYNIGVYHQSNDEYDLAIASYNQALSQDANDVQARVNLGLAHEQKAQQLKSDGLDGADQHVARAEECYRTALKTDPNNVRASLNLSSLLAATERADDGRALLVDLRDRFPGDGGVAAALGAHDLNAGRLEEGIASLRESVRLDDTRLLSWYLLGFGETRAGHSNEARAAFDRALAIRPDDQATLIALARLDVADPARTASAKARLAQLLRLDPDHREAHLLSASVAESEGAFERAVWHLWAARELSRTVAAKEAIEARLRPLYQRLASL